MSRKKNLRKLTSNELPEILSRWKKAKSELDALKKLEADLRLEIAKIAFDGQPEGTNWVELQNGTQVKGVIKINRTVVEAQYQAAMAYAAEKGDQHLVGLLTTAVEFKPSVAAGNFKALSPDDKRRLGDIITEKIGMPDIDVVDAENNGDEQ